MLNGPCRLAALLAAVWVLSPPAFGAVESPLLTSFTISEDSIDRAVQRGRDALLSSISRNSTPDALTILALINAGVSPDDSRIAPHIRRIAETAGAIPESYLGVYVSGITLSLFGAIKDPSSIGAAWILSRKLQNLQEPDGGWGDNSRTQFALLGLKAARDLGVKVGKDVFDHARNYIERDQNSMGGWSYGSAAPPGYNSMTAAGVSSLYIALEDARKRCPLCGAPEENYRLDQGVNWLGQRLNVRAPQPHHFYYLYSLERVGVLLGQKYFGGRDWYREGADYLVRTQSSGGFWYGEDTDRPTEFALLFLAKGRAPIAISKLQYGADWNPDPYDATELADLAGRDLKTPMIAQILQPDASDDEFNAAPILYLQGRRAFEFSPALRERTRKFVEQGGFIVASACCGGSGGFDASFRAEMRAIFPQSQLAALPVDHEIYSIQHKIANPRACALEGLSTGCRPCVFYAPHDVCCAWSGCTGCLDRNAPAAAEARNLGVNLVAYVLRYKALKSKLASAAVNPEALLRAETPERGTLKLGQISYSGEWNPDPESLNNLARRLHDVAGLRVVPHKQPVSLGESDLGEFPVLYLTGHKNFQLPPSAEGALRSYLDRGGFLFCDACCGRPEFDAAFRRLCDNIYPEGKLARIAPRHAIFREPYAIESVVYKAAAKLLFPYVGTAPYLEGVEDDAGRMQIVYSRFNLGCELQNHPCTNCMGIEHDDAFKIAVNAIVYGLSH